MRHFALLLSLALFASACSSGATLSVDVFTDLAPGSEFDEVEVFLFPGGSSRRTSSTELQHATRGSVAADAPAYRAGVRVADFRGLSEGPYTVRVRLFRPGRSGIVAERWSSLVMRGSTRLRVGLDAACVAVTCPAPGGSPAFTECARGRCVDPACTPDDPEGWAEHCCDPLDPNVDCGSAPVIYCGATSDCESTTSSCADVSCASGFCLQVPREGVCGADEYCAREDGCQPRRFEGDAGMPDASMPDASIGNDTGCVDLDRDRWCVGEDCDDNDRNTFEGAAELCDGNDNDCDGRMDEGVIALPWYADSDGDGFGVPSAPVFSCAPVEGRSLVATDCAPDDATAYPGAPERCDRMRSDCLGGGSPGDEDADGDGHASPRAACEGGFPKDDCDDRNITVFAGAPERCDSIDNDCDGMTDEDVVPLPVYADDDGDGYTGTRIVSMSCMGGMLPAGDCNDVDRAIHPGAVESCDMIDSDCDMNLDDAASGTGLMGSVGVCAGRLIPITCPGGVPTPDYSAIPNWQMTETLCDGLDNDCDGEADEGAILVDAYVDNDGDGYGAWDDFAETQTTVRVCPGTPNTSLVGHDIDDMNPLSNPGRIETCNGVDDDGNGAIDGMGLCPPGQLCAAGSCRPCTPVGPNVGGAVTGTQVWCASAGTLNVTSDLVVVPGASLTIEGGVRLLFAAGTGITARGFFEVAGTTAVPVTFTSTTATRSFWDGIASTSDPGANARIQGAVIENGTYALYMLHDRSVPVLGVTIRNAGYALRDPLGRACRDVLIEDSDYGIQGGSGSGTRLLRAQVRRCNGALATGRILLVDSELVENTPISSSGTALVSTLRTLIARNSGRGILEALVSSTYVDNATALEGSATRSNLCRNGLFEIDMRRTFTTTFDFTNNYWCTTSASAIADRIYDFNDDPRLGSVNFTPFLLAPSPTAPPIP